MAAIIEDHLDKENQLINKEVSELTLRVFEGKVLQSNLVQSIDWLMITCATLVNRRILYTLHARRLVWVDSELGLIPPENPVTPRRFSFLLARVVLI